MREKTINIAIFASGSGSNAQKIIEYFHEREDVSIKVVMSNNKDAYVLQRASNFNIPTRVFNRKEFAEQDVIVEELKSMEIEWVILAGFLWLIPMNLIRNFPNKIINIHPALLPMYGGKGMYGMNVHKAVLEAREKESGITIHYIDDKYDEGEIIFQAKCAIEDCTTPELIAERVHALEHQHFPEIIDKLLKNNK